MWRVQGHQSETCPQLIENGGWESANAIGFQGQNQTKYDPYSNTYNPGLREHPNMKWREPQQPAQQEGFRPPPPRMFQTPYAPMQSQQQSAQNNSGSSFDNAQVIQLLTTLAQGQENQAKDIHNYSKEVQNHAKKVQNQARKVNELEKQMGQISEFLGQFREQGKLPSSTVVNPKGG